MGEAITDDLILDEQGFLQVSFSCISYGVQMSIGSIVLYLAFKAPPNNKIPWLWIVYVVTLMICASISVVTTIQPGVKSFILNRNFPGGPMAFLEADYSDPVEVVGNTAYSIAVLLADAMLLHRVNVIWDNNWLIIVIPLLAYLAEIALTILALFQSAKPGASIWTQSAVNVLVPYWSLGIANNVFMTLLIVSRILYTRYKLNKVLGSTYLRLYLSVSTMLVESAALYSIFGIVYIALFAGNNPIQFPIVGFLDQIACIAPELIVLHVVLGRAWSAKTSEVLTQFDLDFQASTSSIELQKVPGVSIPIYSRSETSTGDDSTFGRHMAPVDQRKDVET